MAWYQGDCVLNALDRFAKAAPRSELPFRFPVQDVYKFTAASDDRRIYAGRVATGAIETGEEVLFLPSNKRTRIKHIEGFNMPEQTGVVSGQSTGFQMETQIYARPGELMIRAADKVPHVSTKFKANIFWMGKQPLVKDKTYKLKINAQQVPVVLSEIISVLDASELSSIRSKNLINRHDVAECVLETLKPVAFDEITEIPETGRFVIVDNYEISGGGIILTPVFEERSMIKDHIRQREQRWVRSKITPDQRAEQFQHKPALIVLTGQIDTGKQRIARALEEALFKQGKFVYFLGISNEILTSGDDVNDRTLNKLRHIRQVGELSHVMTEAGLLFITSITDIDEHELKMLKSLNRPYQTIVVRVGANDFVTEQADVVLAENEETDAALKKILEYVEKVISPDPEYTI